MKIKLILTFIILTFVLDIFPQSVRVISRINNLLKDSQELYKTNTDSSIVLAFKAVGLSDSYDYVQGKTEGYLTLGACFFKTKKLNQAESYTRLSLNNCDFEKMTQVYEIFTLLGHIQYQKGFYNKALSHYQRALNIGYNQDMAIHTLLTQMAITYIRLEKLEKALTTLDKAENEIDLSLINNKFSKTTINICRSSILNELNFTTKAINISKHNLRDSPETNKRTLIHCQLINYYIKIGDIHKATKQLKKAQKEQIGCFSLNSCIQLNYTYSNYYLAKNKIDSAEYFLNKTKLNKPHKYDYLKISLNKIKLLILKGKLIEAKDFCLELLEFNTNPKIKIFTSKLNYQLANIYKKLNNRQKELFYYEKYSKYKDSIILFRRNEIIKNIKSKISQNNIRLKNLNKLNSLEEERYSFIITTIITLVTILLISINIFFFYRRVKVKRVNRKESKRLQQKKAINSQLINHVKNLKEIIFDINSSQKTNSVDNNNFKNFIIQLNNLYYRIENITLWNKLQYKNLKSRTIKNDISVFIKEIIKEFSSEPDFKNTKFKIQENTLYVKYDRMILNALLSTILLEILKTNKNSKIEIKAIDKNNMIDIILKFDNKNDTFKGINNSAFKKSSIDTEIIEQTIKIQKVKFQYIEGKMYNKITMSIPQKRDQQQ